MRVLVNDKYTYETDLDLKIGDEVLCPTPSFLRDVKSPTWEGTVTALNSDYTGYCEKIKGIVPKLSKGEKLVKKREEYRRQIETNVLPYKIPKDATGKWTAYYAQFQRLDIHQLATSSSEKDVKEQATRLLNEGCPRQQFAVIKNPKGELTAWADLINNPEIEWYNIRKKEKKKEIVDNNLSL